MTVTKVYEEGRDPRILLPDAGMSVTVVFVDCCAEGRVVGVVTSASYDEDEWPVTSVEFANGSVVKGFDMWEEISGG